MEPILEEFYCTVSGGGCGGYIRITINPELNGIYEVVCPKCDHKHRRMFKDGVATDDGRHSGTVLEQLCPTLAAWSQEAKYPESKRRAESFDRERDAVVIEDNPTSRAFLNDREREIWGKQE